MPPRLPMHERCEPVRRNRQIARWRVTAGESWTITSPRGTTWSGAPSQPAALRLAQSLAAIDNMLARINRQPDYGFRTAP